MCVEHCGYQRWVAGEHLPGCPMLAWWRANAHLRFGPQPTVRPDPLPADQVVTDATGAAEADQRLFLLALVNERDAYDLMDLQDAHYDTQLGSV